MLLYLEVVRGTEALDFLSFPNITGIFLGNLKSFLIAHLFQKLTSDTTAHSVRGETNFATK